MIHSHTSPAAAKTEAHHVANAEHIVVIMIAYKGQWVLYREGDPSFEIHRPAQYLCIHPEKGK